MPSQVNPVEAASGKSALSRVLLAGEKEVSPLARADDQPKESKPSPSTPRVVPTERLELGGSLIQTYAQFVFDEDSHLIQVKIVDAATGEVLREIPPQALADLAASLRAYQDAGNGKRAADLAAGELRRAVDALPQGGSQHE